MGWACDKCGNKSFDIARKFHPMNYEAGNDIYFKCKKCGHEEYMFYD